jgi:hypothetical protein
VSGNRIEADVRSVTPGSPNCCPGAIAEFDTQGDVRGLRIVDNHEVLRARSGLGWLGGTLLSVSADPAPLVVSGAVIARNTITVVSPAGRAWVFGGGIFNAGSMIVRDTRVSGNVLVSQGSGGFAQGGGIWNGRWPGGGRPHLTLGPGVVVTGNVLRTAAGAKREGGGLYTQRRVTMKGARIRDNSPDDRFRPAHP